MPLWLVPLSLAAEPVVVGTADPRGPAPLRVEVVLSWGDVGFAAAAEESPAIGPDILALGPDGAAAVYDPLGRRVIVAGEGAFDVAGADGLAFTAAGVLLVMDGSARVLRAYDTGGALLDEQGFPGVVPPGGTLSVEGAVVVSVDVFGNGHPLATVTSAGALTAPKGPSLLAPSRRVMRSGTSIVVDGQSVATVGERGGGKLFGDWLLVESVERGSVSRVAIPLEGGVSVALPVRGRLYAPAQGVAVGPDGELGWLDPRADGLHIVRVAP